MATAVPRYRLDQPDVASGAARLFGDRVRDFERLRPVYENAEIETRYSCVPIDWYLTEPGFEERNRLYLENAVPLLAAAAKDCIARAGLEVADIGGIVTVSSTGIATPSLDALLMQRLPFGPDTERLPIFGLGCAGGVLGLARAAALARANPDRIYLLLVVELCGLTFRAGDRSKSNVIATALFGDGAAAALVTCRDGFEGPAITATAEHTWPDTLDIMGWNVRDDGLEVQFSRDIPTLVRRDMAGILADFLRRHELAPGDIDTFVPHPGGAKVLDALEEICGLPPGGLVEARAVLRQYGNMSAATVLFVLERSLGDRRRRRLLSSLGPGFSAAFLLLEELA
ncbi:Alpha-pyrone synthesis polyketide synthase-like Pks11 [Oceanibacterium hippocampi]|uniref:Alpha-pyrone synthesis polyketide synthase-like Pks11 n=2 Tax=Oceanibacterium hippocampi TaxID=745714 RepID=A0A1Y5T3S9_9PROT|nr:Alpha-pyrone synthesis polyketide synthase-like Pks11 [Oceanibacterium hippocampi]